MGLIVGQNSWITIVECDTYLTDRIGSEDWFDLADSGDPGALSKTSLVISAFNWLMGAPQLSLSASLTDEFVKNAQIEATLFLLEHYSALNSRRAAMSTGVTAFRMSKKSENLDINKLTIPNHIIGMLSAYSIKNTFVELKGHYDV